MGLAAANETLDVAPATEGVPVVLWLQPMPAMRWHRADVRGVRRHWLLQALRDREAHGMSSHDQDANLHLDPRGRADDIQFLIGWNAWALRAGVVRRHERLPSEIQCDIERPLPLLDVLNLHAHGGFLFWCADRTWFSDTGHRWTDWYWEQCE